jgi:hypothetical protein
MAAVFASVIIDFILMPWLLQRMLGLSALTLVRRAWGRPIAAGALQALMFGGIRLAGQAENWFQLVSQGIVAVLGAATIVLWLGITSDERRRFVLHPLLRLWRGASLRREITSS